MFNLHILQADFGDCLILELGSSPQSRYLLTVGGPKDVYQEHLHAELQRILDSGGFLDLVILGHI